MIALPPYTRAECTPNLIIDDHRRLLSRQKGSSRSRFRSAGELADLGRTRSDAKEVNGRHFVSTSRGWKGRSCAAEKWERYEVTSRRLLLAKS